jgi:hypothetical protein
MDGFAQAHIHRRGQNVTDNQWRRLMAAMPVLPACIGILVMAVLSGCGITEQQPRSLTPSIPASPSELVPGTGIPTASAPHPTVLPSITIAPTSSPDSPQPPDTPAVQANQTRSALPEYYSELLSRAVAEGHVSVIAGLDLPTGPFRPEGALTDSEVQRQRQAIAARREALIGSLEGCDVEAYAWWASLPYVAIRVDRVALEQLIDSPYVTTIQEDTPKDAHGEGPAVEP